MIRALLLGTALFLAAAPAADACPMQDAAAYASAVEKVKSADGEKVVLKVEGLSCGDCSSKVATALKKIDGVTEAAVDYQTGEAQIAFDKEKTNSEALLKVIADTGYTATVNS
jgi:copper chaperone